MDIETIHTNIKNTIAGKQEALDFMQSRKDSDMEPVSRFALIASMEYLKINIKELGDILSDIELFIQTNTQKG